VNRDNFTFHHIFSNFSVESISTNKRELTEATLDKEQLADLTITVKSLKNCT
jgi:hypothetical protein